MVVIMNVRKGKTYTSTRMTWNGILLHPTPEWRMEQQDNNDDDDDDYCSI